MSQLVETVPLHVATSERYLSYALSVITSRALPDVRDGLKPVQRRILYTMYSDMGLTADARYRKCAVVVGEVMGKYHPHGDSSIYDALVRMAQSFSMRAPLVDGQGNFGSLDGDPPAAFRYTECRLRPIAEELLSEIDKQTVDFRPNYDGQRLEPVVLPARLPHLLINGSEGIAVGIATRIPPHNLAEVVSACIALIEDRSLTVRDLLGIVKGPDFPTGGHILTTPAELEKIYETGQGSLKVRATWSEVDEGAGRQIILDTIPYGQNKAKLVEHVGEEVRTRRLPQVVDVRDESTDQVRIVLDLQPDARAEDVMAYLFKRTDLQTTWPVNLTALVPVPGADVPTPARLDLKQMLEHWLDFRLETVRRRYRYDLELLRKRIHILEGFATIFDALDEAIRMIRASDGKKDAARRLVDRFELSEVQADAILELQLYKLARLEIEGIREELADKRARADHIEKILASESKLWGEVRKELQQIRKEHGAPRLALVEHEDRPLEFDENAYIVAEDTYVVVTRDGWTKRQSTFRGLDKVRVREGDEIGWLLKANTRSTLTFFTNHGSAYVLRVGDIAPSTGYGEPVQASFAFADGEVVVGVLSNDERHRIPARPLADPEDPPTPYAAAITVGGRGMRFSLVPHAEISNRTGRRFARLAEGDQVLAVWGLPGEDDRICLGTSTGRTPALAACELPLVKAAGKGLSVVALEPGERVVAFELGDEGSPGPRIEPTTAAETSRAGRARQEAAYRWVRAPVVREGEPTEPDPEALRSLAPYKVLPRTGPTPEERREAAAKRAAERQAAAERRQVERQAAAERAAEKRAEAERRKAERQALAEQKAAERQALAERRAAEKQAAADKKAAEQQERAAARQAAAEQRAAEKQAAAERKEAERRVVAERRAAEQQAAAERAAARKAAAEQKAAEKQAKADAKRAAAERKAAEKQEAADRKQAERQAAAERRAAAERAAAERAAEKKAAAEQKAAEKQARADARRAAAERKAAEKQEAADRKEAEKRATAERRAAAEQAAAERAAARKAAAEQKAAEKQAEADARRAAAEKKAAEKQAAADRKEAEKQAAAERRAAAERVAAERAATRKAAAEEKAAKTAAKEEKAAERQARAAEKQARAERGGAKATPAEPVAGPKAAAPARKAAADRKSAETEVPEPAAEPKPAEKPRGAPARKATSDREAAGKGAPEESADPKLRGSSASKASARKAAETDVPEPAVTAEKPRGSSASTAPARKAAADQKAAETDVPEPAEDPRAAEKPRGAAASKAPPRKAAADQKTAETDVPEPAGVERADEKKATADEPAAENRAAEKEQRRTTGRKAAAQRRPADQQEPERAERTDRADRKAAEQRRPAEEQEPERAEHPERTDRSVRKAAQPKAAQRQALEPKAAEEPAAAGKKAAQRKAAQQQAVEPKAAEEWAEARKKAPRKAADRQAAAEKASEKKATEKRASEKKASENAGKAAERQGAPERRARKEPVAAGPRSRRRTRGGPSTDPTSPDGVEDSEE